MTDVEDPTAAPGVVVAPLAQWWVVESAKGSLVSGAALTVAVAATTSPDAVLHAFVRGAVWFGVGFLALIVLFTGGRFALGRREPDRLPLPDDATILPAASLWTRGWRGEATLVAVSVGAYLIGGPRFMALLAGYGPGAIVASLVVMGAETLRSGRRQFIGVARSAGRRTIYSGRPASSTRS